MVRQSDLVAIRGEMAQLRGELKAEIGELRVEIESQLPRLVAAHIASMAKLA